MDRQVLRVLSCSELRQSVFWISAPWFVSFLHANMRVLWSMKYASKPISMPNITVKPYIYPHYWQVIFVSTILIGPCPCLQFSWFWQMVSHLHSSVSSSGSRTALFLLYTLFWFHVTTQSIFVTAKIIFHADLCCITMCYHIPAYSLLHIIITWFSVYDLIQRPLTLCTP